MQGVKVTGVQETMAALDAMGKGVANRAAFKAVSAAGGVLKPEVKKRVPRETRMLERSIIVKAGKKKAGGVYALVGANRNLTASVTTAKHGRKKLVATFRQKKDGSTSVSGGKRLDKATAAGARLTKRKPSRYLHLVDQGTKRGVKPQRFMQKAVDAKGAEAVARFQERLRKGFDEELAKARR